MADRDGMMRPFAPMRRGHPAYRQELSMRTLAAVTLAITASALAFGFTTAANGQTAAEFYKDKRIDLIISSTVGGGNDVSARLLARYFTANMPGNPTLIPRNMPGAGG